MNSTKATERIKRARKAAKLTQGELAIKVNTTKGTISNYENGHSTPSNQMLVALADVLDVTTDYLLGRTDETKGAAEMDRETIKKLERLENSVYAEKSYINTLKLLDYVNTKEILDAVNHAIISGFSPEDIVSILRSIKK